MAEYYIGDYYVNEFARRYGVGVATVERAKRNGTASVAALLPSV